MLRPIGASVGLTVGVRVVARWLSVGLVEGVSVWSSKAASRSVELNILIKC